MLSPAASGMVDGRMRLTHVEPRLHCSARFASADDAMEFTFERFTDGRDQDNVWVFERAEH